ncbi:MAG: PD40 domain-containing protein, partial [Sedimentisphaerales bacterium]|nr:PD40 domain-containing protein [Sedimentisphaerales bacterium]
EGVYEWRKGYHGSKAAQIWLYDFDKGTFKQVVSDETGARCPLWGPDGKGFYYTSARDGARNLWYQNLGGGGKRQLTHFDDDSVQTPCLSRDGSTIVFQHLFDLYRLETKPGSKPVRLAIDCPTDGAVDPVIRKWLRRADEVTFTRDGLEVAFTAEGDVWVMDTELRQPRRVTTSPECERCPAFSPDGKTLLFVSDAQGQSDVWTAARADATKGWWENERFPLTRLTEDAATERYPKWSPDGKSIAFLKQRGDLWVMRSDGKEARRVVSSWSKLDYDWSPDGRWFVYALEDDDFNRDIWIAPVDGSREPVNLSRHPDDDESPVWSPDGRAIAFTGRRLDNEVDICFVYLQKSDDETNAHDRRVRRAEEKIEKARGRKSKRGSSQPATIDFDGLHRRVRRVSIPNAKETHLFWSHDSKRLAFTATIDGRSGTYTISPPGDLKPRLLSTRTGTHARWIAHGDQIVWRSNKVPGCLWSANKGKDYQPKDYPFSIRYAIDRGLKYRVAFDLAWRTMRDSFYDGALNNRNWDAIRRKYAPVAQRCATMDQLSQVMHLMLGELNGSHLKFMPHKHHGSNPDAQWTQTTAHLGLRFDPAHQGPGLKVAEVIPGSPADHVASRVHVGETVLSIDGVTVDPDIDLTTVLNGSLDRDIRLLVRNSEDKQRTVSLRPIDYEKARELRYEAWVQANRREVEKRSQGRLGYLHIAVMNMPDFYRFEREVYAAGAGKDGLVIDVRNNKGGFVADHLLTVLTQPKHSITVGRGGGPGYPQDRFVFATWDKPIVVLCNQNSFSNAEIFTHAVKYLQRGQVVGVPTAGGVISTGATEIMDLGTLRVPFRGWFRLPDGQDMELNPAVPDHLLWPRPCEISTGADRQLRKAIEVLQSDVAKWKKRPQPKLQKASQRRK